MRVYSLIVLIALVFLLAACGGGSGNTVSRQEMDEMLHKQNQRIFDMFDGHGVYHKEHVTVLTDVPKNRGEILAGDLSSLTKLRDPDPDIYVYYPDIPRQSTAYSYFEILETGKHVDASIMVADGFGFARITTIDDLEVDVIYCLPAELSEMGETSERCFSTSAVQAVPSG